MRNIFELNRRTEEGGGLQRVYDDLHVQTAGCSIENRRKLPREFVSNYDRVFSNNVMNRYVILSVDENMKFYLTYVVSFGFPDD